MTSTEHDLAAIQQELERVLEDRMTTLLAQVKAVQEVTAQIASASLDIKRQEALRGQLEADLASMSGESAQLEEGNAEMQGRLDKLKTHVDKMKSLRAELMSGLSDLTGQLSGD